MAASETSAPTWDEHTPCGRLEGRRIVITGAASGIASRTAEVFASEGASLGLVDRDGDGVAVTAERTGAFPEVADVTDENEVGRAVGALAESLGGIDGVVNAAGITIPGGIDEIDIDDWNRVLAVNLTGPFIVTRACLPWLRTEPRATVTMVASGQGLVPNGPPASAYAASKGGLINLTRTLAIELAPTIRVNSVNPGMVLTAMTIGHEGDGSQYALQRNGTATEIAEAILYLTSHESAFTTGIALPVDGGRTFH